MVGCIIQARLGSSRFPGKVLQPIRNLSALGWVVERIGSANTVQSLVVAIPEGSQDLELVHECERLAVSCVAGAEDDVLSRYYKAASMYDMDPVIRITADCPLIDPAIVDQTVQMYFASGAVYCSNVLPPTYPDGMDVEVFSFASLALAHREATKRYQREHVTPHITETAGHARIANVHYKEDLSAYRLTLDHPEDLVLLNTIADRLEPSYGRRFPMEAIVELLRAEPRLVAINDQFARNEGFVADL